MVHVDETKGKTAGFNVLKLLGPFAMDQSFRLIDSRPIHVELLIDAVPTAFVNALSE